MSFKWEIYQGNLQRTDLSRVALSTCVHSFVFNWYQASSKKRINGIYNILPQWAKNSSSISPCAPKDHFSLKFKAKEENVHLIASAQLWCQLPTMTGTPSAAAWGTSITALCLCHKIPQRQSRTNLQKARRHPLSCSLSRERLGLHPLGWMPRSDHRIIKYHCCVFSCSDCLTAFCLQ